MTPADQPPAPPPPGSGHPTPPPGAVWVWRAPPAWPPPPPGWTPPAGWQPPPAWPPPPPGWQFWVPAAGGVAPPLYGPPPRAPGPPPLPPVRFEAPTRRNLVRETWFVVLAFVFPGVVSAVTVLVRHLQGVSDVDRFPTVLPGHPLTNMILGIVNYLAIAVVVPVALLLLARTGQPPSSIGLGRPRFMADVWPGLGLAAAAYGTAIALLIPFAALLAGNTKVVNPTVVTHVPAYYVVYGLVIAATTSITEEVIVNGYLLTRLEQFGWSPQRALALSLTLRTSYHVYYGLGFLLTVPFGYYVTRSFQKHRRLNRPIAAHFVYDAVLITISVLTS